MSLNLEQYAGSREFPVIDAGEYEFVLKAEKKSTKDGSKEFLNLDFLIRDDVDQKYNDGKTHVFDKAWKEAENPKWFDFKKLGSILVTQKNKEGYKTDWEEVDEFIQFINGITLIATVEKKYDDYAEKEVNSIKYLSYKPSAAGPYKKPAKKEDSVPLQEVGDEGVKGANVEQLDLPEGTEVPF